MHPHSSLKENSVCSSVAPYGPQGEISQVPIMHYNIKETLLPGCKKMVKTKIFGWKHNIILKGVTLNYSLEANVLRHPVLHEFYHLNPFENPLLNISVINAPYFR